MVPLSPEFCHEGYFRAGDTRGEDRGADDGFDAVVLGCVDQAVAV
jgi:hypothetical protein